MNLVKNNPNRILGILAGATARVQEKQIRKLRQYIDAQQSVLDDFSFPDLGRIIRTSTSIANAASQLTLEIDKMNAALFWFCNGNPITDEPALELLKESDQTGCIAIWAKLIGTGNISQRNFSAYQNLSTLYICNSTNGPLLDTGLLTEGIRLKLEFLDSTFFDEFKKIVIDETFQINTREVQLLFINLLCKEIWDRKCLTQNELFELLSRYEFSAKKDFLNEYVKKPIEQLEKAIAEAKLKRNVDPSNTAVTGDKLYKQTIENLGLVKSVLGITNSTYSYLADKVSEEILQCAIAYFDYHKESNVDPGEKAMRLVQKAKKIAIGKISEQRCLENLESLEEWINDRPQRKKRELILKDLSSLVEILEKFTAKPGKKDKADSLMFRPRSIDLGPQDSIDQARFLILECKPLLKKIRTVLGPSGELYLNISTKVSDVVLSYVVTQVNNAQEAVSNKNHHDSLLIYFLSLTLKKAWDITALLGVLDMETDFTKKIYLPNKSALKSLCMKLNVDTQDVKIRLKNSLTHEEEELNRKQQWHFLRSEIERNKQIQEQQKKISSITKELEQFEF